MRPRVITVTILPKLLHASIRAMYGIRIRRPIVILERVR